ncbi:hypothetical protein PENTCL1PPCAC_4944, partial [Pristionchus entomophagus]
GLKSLSYCNTVSFPNPPRVLTVLMITVFWATGLEATMGVGRKRFAMGRIATLPNGAATAERATKRRTKRDRNILEISCYPL